MSPDGVMRPTLSFPALVNHRFPSGPATMWAGNATPAWLPSNMVISPEGVMRPRRLANVVNHRFPSGPAVMEVGKLKSSPPLLPANVTSPAGVTRPKTFSIVTYHTLPSGPAANAIGGP